MLFGGCSSFRIFAGICSGYIVAVDTTEEYGLLNYLSERIGIQAPTGWEMPAGLCHPSRLQLSGGLSVSILRDLLAALQDIPQELQDAARIDGANAGKVFWYITLY